MNKPFRLAMRAALMTADIVTYPARVIVHDAYDLYEARSGFVPALMDASAHFMPALPGYKSEYLQQAEAFSGAFLRLAVDLAVPAWMAVKTAHDCLTGHPPDLAIVTGRVAASGLATGLFGLNCAAMRGEGCQLRHLSDRYML